MNETKTNTIEQRLRRQAKRQGLGLKKSRVQNIHGNDLGGWMIFDVSHNYVEAGGNFDLSLDDVDEFLNGPKKKKSSPKK